MIYVFFRDYYIRVVLGDYQISKFSHREQVLNPDRIFRVSRHRKKENVKISYDKDTHIMGLSTSSCLKLHDSIAESYISSIGWTVWEFLEY